MSCWAAFYLQKSIDDNIHSGILFVLQVNSREILAYSGENDEVFEVYVTLSHGNSRICSPTC